MSKKIINKLVNEVDLDHLESYCCDKFDIDNYGFLKKEQLENILSNLVDDNIDSSPSKIKGIEKVIRCFRYYDEICELAHKSFYEEGFNLDFGDEFADQILTRLYDILDKVFEGASRKNFYACFTTADISAESAVALFGINDPKDECAAEFNAQIISAYESNKKHSPSQQSLRFDFDSIYDAYTSYVSYRKSTSTPVDFKSYISTIHREFLEEIH